MKDGLKDLKILPVKTDEMPDARWDVLDPRLPRPPFLMVLNAPVASGKSTAIINFLYNDNYYRDLFDSIIVVSPTIANDISWKVALTDDRVKIVTGDRIDQADDIIRELYERQLELVKKANEDGTVRPHILLILDDCIGLLGKEFENLCTRHRHPCISMMVSTQNFRSLGIKCRQNASQHVIFRTNNLKELAKMNDEFSSNFPGFMKIYDEATRDPYSFLVINQRTVSAYKRFEEKLWARDDEKTLQWRDDDEDDNE